MARAQFKRIGLLKEPLSSEEPGRDSGSLSLDPPPFFQTPSYAPHEAQRKNGFNWLAASAVVSFAAPITIGFLLGHPMVGSAVGAFALLAVGLVAVGLDALDNSRPF